MGCTKFGMEVSTRATGGMDLKMEKGHFIIKMEVYNMRVIGRVASPMVGEYATIELEELPLTANFEMVDLPIEFSGKTILGRAYSNSEVLGQNLLSKIKVKVVNFQQKLLYYN